MSRNDPASVEEEVIESMEQSAEVYGLSRSAGRVYGELYFAEESLSIPELVEETGYAKSTISNVTRKLDRIGLIHRRSSEGGGRRVEFEPERELWFVIQDVLQQYLHREISATRRTLDRALDQLDALENSEVAPHERERIEALRASYGELGDLLEISRDHSVTEITEAIEQYDG
ncbi:MAG: GbsR/MarR family transcriptional regulator [Halobacteriales archaeon]